MTFCARWMSLFSALWFICAGICHASPVGGYLFTTFRDETSPMSEQIYMAVSPDGRHWQALNKGNPVLVSDVGEKGVRDSFLLRSHDGKKVWLIATDLSAYHHRDWNRNTHAGSRSIVVWETDDLVHWSAPRLVTVAAPDAGCTWAPEAIYDPDTGDYLVYWASTTARDNYNKQRIGSTNFCIKRLIAATDCATSNRNAAGMPASGAKCGSRRNILKIEVCPWRRPLRPRRCRRDARECGGPICATDFTEPMSIPNSSVVVATPVVGKAPAFSRCSSSSRNSLDKLP